MKHLTYLKTIRKFCVECMGGSPKYVADCPSYKCLLYSYRNGKRPKSEKAKYSPLKSIRKYCIECVGTSNEVRNCSMPECPVYYYRFGKNPKLAGKRMKSKSIPLKLF